MKNKIWYCTEITTEAEQNVSISPDETFSGIIVKTKEMDGDPFTSRMYLNRDEMEFLIIKMKEMMSSIDGKY